MTGLPARRGQPVSRSPSRERAVCGTLLEDHATLPPNLSELVRSAPASFLEADLGDLVAAIRRVRESGEPVNPVRLLDVVGAERAMLLATLPGEALPLAAAEHEAAGLINDFRLRQTRQLLLEAAQALETNPDAGREVRQGVIEGLGSLDTAATTAEAIPLSALPNTTEPDPDELIRDRFLCRGGSLLFVGRTGLGKSSLAMQLAVMWSLGRAGFGLRPAARHRSLFIQAENDARDMAEQRSGIFDGLELGPEDREAAGTSIHVARVDDAVGEHFVRHRFAPLIERVRPDLVWLDPLLSYLGDDVCNQAAVSAFLRSHLAPVINRYRIGLILIHHTAKPPREETASGWVGSDYAYSGAGSAELANFPRAVLVLEPSRTEGVFALRAGKRGRRAGWVESDGHTPSYSRWIAHGERGICWRHADPAQELKAVAGKEVGRAEILELVPGERPISKQALISIIQSRKRIGANKARGLIAELVDAQEVFEWRVRRPGTNPARFIARQPQPPEPHQNARAAGAGNEEGARDAAKAPANTEQRP